MMRGFLILVGLPTWKVRILFGKVFHDRVSFLNQKLKLVSVAQQGLLIAKFWEHKIIKCFTTQVTNCCLLILRRILLDFIFLLGEKKKENFMGKSSYLLIKKEEVSLRHPSHLLLYIYVILLLGHGLHQCNRSHTSSPLRRELCMVFSQNFILETHL